MSSHLLSAVQTRSIAQSFRILYVNSNMSIIKKNRETYNVNRMSLLTYILARYHETNSNSLEHHVSVLVSVYQKRFLSNRLRLF